MVNNCQCPPRKGSLLGKIFFYLFLIFIILIVILIIDAQMPGYIGVHSPKIQNYPIIHFMRYSISSMIPSLEPVFGSAWRDIGKLQKRAQEETQEAE